MMVNHGQEHRVRAHVATVSPCKLERGALRRMPQNRRSWPYGYHVCCPRCGFVSIAFNALVQKSSELDFCSRVDEHAEGGAVNGSALTIDESVTGEVTFSQPLRCVYCAVLIHIERCVIYLEEDEHVRPLQYK